MTISTKRAHRLPASTLVEVLVALVIYTLAIAVAASIYAALIRQQPHQDRNLQLALVAFAEQAKRERNYDTEQFHWEHGVTVMKAVSAYEGDTLLMQLELRASRRGSHEVVMYREIIINE